MTSSIYLKTKKDYNNVFLEDGKILKVGRSPEVPWSLPHLPPLSAFFSWGRNILFQISGGAYSQGGHMPPLFFKQGGHMHTVPHGCARLCLKCLSKCRLLFYLFLKTLAFIKYNYTVKDHKLIETE